MFLDTTQNFNLHIKETISKVMRGIGVIQKLIKVLPRYFFIAVYKSFVEPHLEYGLSFAIIYVNQLTVFA